MVLSPVRFRGRVFRGCIQGNIMATEITRDGITTITRTEAELQRAEAATRKAIMRGAKARGKFTHRSQPAGNIVGAISPEAKAERERRAEINTVRAELGLPKLPSPASDHNAASQGICACIIVTQRSGTQLPKWEPHKWGGLRYPPIPGSAMAKKLGTDSTQFRQPGERTDDTYSQWRKADAKKYNLDICPVIPDNPDAVWHQWEVYGEDYYIRQMLLNSHIADGWIQSWQYPIDAGIGRGAPAGSGPVGSGAKRRIAEQRQERIALAEDRFIAGEREFRPGIITESERTGIAQLCAAFGVAPLTKLVFTINDAIGKPIEISRHRENQYSVFDGEIIGNAEVVEYKRDKEGNPVRKIHDKPRKLTTTAEALFCEYLRLNKFEPDSPRLLRIQAIFAENGYGIG